jgi:CubicO group peptidase (beta-lactamase class C family)
MNPGNTKQFYCSGYDGQRILCDPEKDLVIVRLGRTPADQVNYVWDRVDEIVNLF